ncbi:MAG: LysM peptidoglycan-binding domain-containing protein, partial [Betaproteobacteria bacterium]|nr:LysM peptidoglycan-binding domain-containing protein [Betaproteobacteria bacterium]
AEPSARSARAAPPAGRAGVGAPPAAAAAPAAAPAAAADSAGGEKITVKRGDTLGGIAGRVRPAAASIEQTLAALYEANPQAFSGSVNRLKADSTLTVPPAGDIVAYDSAKARELLLAQSADFSSYRAKVAATAPEVGGEKAGQSGAGKVGAKVEDRSAATSQDQLRISKSGTPAAKASPAGGVGQANAEQTAAREAALKESQARVAELEKNVADLQKLIDLRSRQLAELQKQAEAGRAPADKPAAEAAKPVAPPVDAARAAPDAAAKPPEAAPAPAPAPAPVAAKRPPPPPPPEPSLVDELLDNPFTLPAVGGVLALGAGYGWFAMRRRRKAAQAEENLIGGEALSPNSLFGSTGGQSVDTSTAFGTANPETGVDVQATEVDPIAEAEVYIAYGREAQAEEILREALRKQPRRQAIRAKLLEIYAGRKDVASFGELAAEMHEMTGGQNEEWPKVAAMGLALDPENPLYSGQAGAPAEGEPAEGLFEQESLDARLEAGPTMAAPPAEPEPALDFDLELEDTKINPPTDLQKAVDGKFDLPDLDLEPPTVAAPPAEAQPLDLDLASLDGDEARADTEVAVHEPEDEVRWQEMGTKLDLASAYEEIGDKEGARELLDEVLKAGDADQKRRAREMLDRLS